ncbi:MAG: tRNA guanosine(34) transglycosylase Tgt [Acidobacteria bacterium]|nr:tRNA guanosine(34) transglycosylase Tgt [Acidobacteriota bacterium]
MTPSSPRVFDFHVTDHDGAARRGVMSTAHGVVETPAFMPVGTRGAVKAMTHRDLVDLGAEIILANTYHLHLRPGADLIERLGGLHRFTGWDRPILTDSGGYQVFSLASRRTVDDEGVRFRSHLDGEAHLLTPERATDLQWALGSDVAMAFDECVAFPADASAARQAMERTLRWGERARRRFEARRAAGTGVNPGQAQFGIVQGGVHGELRAESVDGTVALGFEAYAIGGLSVGEPVPVMYDVVAETAPRLPTACPRYLMGAGTPVDLVEAVSRGVDLFDCVLPTRNARNGQLFTSQGRLNIKQARFADDPKPPDERCACYTCRGYSRAYLRHLYVSDEMSAATLNTLHNLHFYLDTMRRIREGIKLGTLETLRQEFHLLDSRPQAHAPSNAE